MQPLGGTLTMQFPTGTFTLSNENGDFILRTSREGIGARAGHDLDHQDGGGQDEGQLQARTCRPHTN